MARGPKKWDEATIERFRMEGCGQGEGSAYKPWLSVFDFSSKGTSRRIWGIKTDREHHVFSDTERDILVWAEWAPNVIDIREQYPLDRDLTLEIAAAAEIRHPHYPGTHVPTVMTVDFLLTVMNHGTRSLIAINGKREEEAENAESLEKLEIQRRYFEGMDASHQIVFHSKIPKLKVQNILWFRDAWLKPNEIEPSPGFFAEHRQRMTADLIRRKQDRSLSDYCSQYDVKHGLEVGTGLRITRMLMWERTLMPDLSSPNLPDSPLASFIVTAQPGRLRAVL